MARDSHRNVMSAQQTGTKRHQFRLVLCGHKALEAGAVCIVLMVQGHLADVTLAHLGIAAKTALLAISPVLGLTFSRYARHLLNRWTAATLLGACTFVADALVHPTHYPGEYTEAALTALGAAAFSLALAYTPIGARIDRLAESFLDEAEPREATDAAASHVTTTDRSSASFR